MDTISATAAEPPRARPTARLTRGDFQPLLRHLLAGGTLSTDESAAAMGAVFDQTISQVQASALVTALATRGETIDEVVGAATALRLRAVPLRHRLPLVMDVVGTGGDGSGSINISTAAALVVAGAGVAVAKHGNRAASSACGSADALEALGVPLEREPESAAQLLLTHRITFLFAPRYHPAMRQGARLRRELGVRTIFNLLGPLCNPAGVQRQLMGVYGDTQLELFAEALPRLGCAEGAVVHSASGMDEVAGEGPTTVVQFSTEGRRRWTINPEDHGIRASLPQLRGGDAKTNAGLILEILQGQASPRADVVALNAALALTVAGAAGELREGLALARTSLDSGAALGALEALRAGPGGVGALLDA
ncbi:MAG: anthranilate phosphoribosyltransferase [Candidatus Dormibacteria bacterium]